MRFIDEARVYVQAGKGGDGAIAFLREKYRPFGGPAGGDGGRGGSVIFEVNEGMSTLLDFKYKPRLVARDGEGGRGKQQYGHQGDDLVVKVPPGTMVFDEDTGELIADMVIPNERAIIAQAGKGGLGNMHFASSTRRAPRIATPGTPGVQRWVKLELRLVAEAGLVGLPNAGKSTLLSALTAARPKIAPYPFTTLTPNLGHVQVSDEESFNIADIPGLIEGAHLGHGLGIKFLRHIKRTRVLVYVLDVSADPENDFATVRHEVAEFDDEMIERPALIALNKADLVTPAEAEQVAHLMRTRTGLEVLVISAEQSAGLDPVVAAIVARLRLPLQDLGAAAAESPVNYKEAIIAPLRRLVVKVGSAVLSDPNGLRPDVIANLARQIDAIIRDGREVVLVTSGAIAAGRARLGHRASTIAERQAAAATGQIELMRQWAKAFDAHGRTVAQLLLTHQDLAERKRRLNATRTIESLFAAGAIPIVNENDTVAVEEIRMGDNDVLSSLVAGMVQAGLLIILSDVAGVLTGDPRTRPDARLIPLITDPEAGMRGLVAESAGPLGSGGMATKLRAARQAVRAGICVIIAPGREPDTLTAALDPSRETGTLILPAHRRLPGRKHWIAFALRPSGAIAIDRGAADALRSKGRSLLPSGIREVRGEFASGDCVSLLDPDGVEFGRGLVNYPAADVLKVKGMRSQEIPRVLGYKVADEIIHRDNFVLIEDLA